MTVWTDAFVAMEPIVCVKIKWRCFGRYRWMGPYACNLCPSNCSSNLCTENVSRFNNSALLWRTGLMLLTDDSLIVCLCVSVTFTCLSINRSYSCLFYHLSDSRISSVSHIPYHKVWTQNRYTMLQAHQTLWNIRKFWSHYSVWEVCLKATFHILSS